MADKSDNVIARQARERAKQTRAFGQASGQASAQTTETESPPVAAGKQAKVLFDKFVTALVIRTDKLFAGLMLIQYVLSVICAQYFSQNTSQVSVPAESLRIAATIGAVLTALPVGFALSQPGRLSNAYVITVCQMLLCGVIVLITGGRVESVFAVYISMGLLVFYRKWRILLLGAAVGVLDFGWLYYHSQDGQALSSTIEYTAWLAFETVFLIVGCRQVLAEWRIASQELADIYEGRRREIEARVAKERELELSTERERIQEERLSLILERSYEAFIAIDEEGLITDWNKQAEHTFGWKKSEVLGSRLSETIIPEGFREAHERGMKRFLETGVGTIVNRSIEVPALHRAGHEFPIELSVTPVRIGSTLTICAFLRDITERKRLIEELGQARDKAQELSRLKSQFVANMSHEIRTPMNGIIGMSGILLKTALNRKQFEYVNTIKDAGMSLLGIINDILDLSKIEAEKIELENAPFSPSKLIESIGELLAPQAKAKGLSFMTFVAPEVPVELQGDAERLKQILLNLAGNAVKFSEKGKVVVSLSVDSDLDNKLTLRFCVEDTGVGISTDEQKILFQPFVQADGSIGRKYGGTGLGLSISKRLVELMGGEIGLESEKGEGSTFWFKVIFDCTDKSALRASYDHLKNVRMLIIDDQTYATDMLVSYLDSWGLRSEKVDGTESAFEKLENAANEGDPFQVVFLDLHSSNETKGAQALEFGKRILQSEGPINAVKLILVHDLDDVNVATDAIDIGFKAALTRPLKQSQLLDALARIMSRKQPERKQIRFTHELSLRSLKKAVKRDELILVADDHPINRQVMTIYLSDFGFDAHTATNGIEAAEALAKHNYALAFMDCQMPELDGLEATRRIRQSEADAQDKRHVPIVAMTAHAMEGDRANCLEAGMDDYLSKPISEDDLREILMRWIPGLDLAVYAAPDPDPEKSVEAAGAVYREKPIAVPADSNDPTGFLRVTADDIKTTIALLRSKLGKARAQSLADVFLSDSVSSLKRLRLSIEAANSTEVAASAHYFRGSWSMMQSATMPPLCAQLEAAAKNEDWAEVKEILRSVEYAFLILKDCADELANEPE